MRMIQANLALPENRSQIEDLLTYGQPVVIDVISSLHECIRSRISGFKDKNISIKIKYDKAKPFLSFGPKAALSQVLYNLLSEVKKSISKTRAVSTGMLQDAQVEIELSSSGNGAIELKIAYGSVSNRSTEADRSFEPFIQNDNIDNETNLRHFMAKQIIENYFNSSIETFHESGQLVYRVTLPVFDDIKASAF